ncbi:hypothetical protein CEXT_404201 [Caerostris extrusa]|uniref:Uncharacterized protein n=1 Tax=Caerostris extrusa TaxID=172846 RepID=A0AAV4MGD1_CAEEX|nr:hypothetical protein CEXT_404201 [Caerostris extrusa]
MTKAANDALTLITAAWMYLKIHFSKMVFITPFLLAIKRANTNPSRFTPIKTTSGPGVFFPLSKPKGARDTGAAVHSR